MEDMPPLSSLFSSRTHGADHRDENKIIPSSPYQLPTMSAPPNVYAFLISSLLFCMIVRWGLPRLLNLFKSNSNSPLSSCSTPSTVSTDPSPGRPYDVFLNHRGPDVKRTLASSIYHWLDEKGLRVFFDKEEFQAADELHSTIQQAISSSSVHVAIFSKGYAESSWCLDELCSMLESGAKIIPVYYDGVRPSDLRWIGQGKSLYDRAFADHRMKRRFPSQRIDQWKAALKGVSYLYGLELHGENFQGDWGKLLRSVADAVLEAIEEKMPQGSPKDAVGLDDAVEHFQEFLQSMEQENKKEATKIVGIVGLGGSGKTTLARRLYEIRRSSFNASSFLSDVRYAAAQQKLQSLQRKLLKDLSHSNDGNIERGSVIEGRQILKTRLQSSTPRVLIVLDDIDQEEQVENLVTKEALGPGSLILVTCRDKYPLSKSGADSIYQIKPLKKNHALELFCRRAFGQPRPKKGFEVFAEKFCAKCRGLPLFLRVMGAHLRAIGGDDKDVWKEELGYIPDDIENILEISYKVLRNEEKQIFLDVACFLVGQNKSSAIRVWKRSEKRVLAVLKNLENKCLVEVDNENRLRMHDHLRDFGRKKAKEERPCRFWDSHQISNIREELKGSREVRGIMAASGEVFRKSTLKSAFKLIEFSSLTFLDIIGDCLHGGFGQQATNLMWLRWFDFPYRSIPSWLISLENLTVLEVRSARLKKWPACDKQLPLKELIIQYTQLSKISFPEDVWPHLEHLDLCGNKSLIEVEHLPSTLLLLKLDGCTMLNKISGSFHLPRLEKVNISGCSKLYELPNLSGLTSLETLEVGGCDELEDIQGLEHLCKLQKLSISSCFMLVRFPNLSGLTSLETLEVDRCSLKERMQGLELLCKLKKLSISGCFMSDGLSNLSGLTSLETLDVEGCGELKSIQGLEHLRKLQKLSIRFCYRLRELSNLSGLTSLETLEAHGCSNLQDIQGLEHLRKLKNLNISFCYELHSLSDLSGLTSLETLDARDCIRLQKMRGAEHLRKLKHLNICGCSELDELPNLFRLSSLETLQAECCWKLRSIDGLDQLEQLTLLSLSAANGNRTILKSIQHMKKLPSRLLFTAVGAGSNALSFPGLPISDFSYSREEHCWKSEMHAWTDGMPCTALMVCHVVEPEPFPTAVACGLTLLRESTRCFEMNQELSHRHRPPLRWTHTLDKDVGWEKWVCVAVFSQFLEAPDPTSTFHWRPGFLLGMEPTKGGMLTLSEGNGGQVSEIIDKLLG